MLHGMKLAAVITTACAMAGCGTFSTKNKGEKAKQNDVDLAGEWENSCAKLDWFGTAYQREIYKFTAVGDFDRVTTVYSDEECHTPVAELSEHGTYTALGASAEVKGARDINLTTSEASIVAQTDKVADALATASYCGVSDWQKDRDVNVIGKECLGKTHAKGEVVYDIYRVDNNPKRLVTGKGSFFVDKSKADARPTSLDEDRAFGRK